MLILWLDFAQGLTRLSQLLTLSYIQQDFTNIIIEVTFHMFFLNYVL